MFIEIYADGADLATIRRMAGNPVVAGFTTNPSLLRKAGVENYEDFARKAITEIGRKTISLEVLSDDTYEMAEQARTIAGWGANVYVKIPIVTSTGESCVDVIRSLAAKGVKVNVTAVFTRKQAVAAMKAIGRGDAPGIVSVFAGRIADTLRDPETILKSMSDIRPNNVKLLWASCREIYNVLQAERSGCDIITLFPQMIDKLVLKGKNLEEYAVETVAMFVADAKASRYTL